MHERSILFTTRFRSGTERNIQRYSAADMAEVFTADQRAELAAGKSIEYRAETDAVDLLAFYDANKGAAV